MERHRPAKPAEPTLDELLRLKPGDLGNQIRHAVRHGGGSKLDGIMDHVMSHQVHDDERNLSADECAFFDRLRSADFFSFGQKRLFEGFEPQMKHLLILRGLLPASAREGFFEMDGAGRRLLGQVNSSHKIGNPTREDGRRGMVVDYLRRITAMLPFVPVGERLRFISEDIPQALSKSPDYTSFLNNTLPLVDRYVRAEKGNLKTD